MTQRVHGDAAGDGAEANAGTWLSPDGEADAGRFVSLHGDTQIDQSAELPPTSGQLGSGAMGCAGVRGSSAHAWVVAAGALFVAATADASVLLSLEHSGRPPSEDTTTAVVEVFRAQDPDLATGPSVSVLAARRWRDTTEGATEAAFLQAHGALAAGRDAFFESDFAFAITTFGAVLDAVERDPALLALHPDLATSTFEAGLTLARAQRAVGDEAAEDATFRRVAALFWLARPSSAVFPPDVIARYEEVRGVVPTRELAIDWGPAAECALEVNGFAHPVRPGDVVRLPEGAHFARLACAAGRSAVLRVDPRSPTLFFDIGLDDALQRAGDGVRLRPRSDSAPALRALLVAAARAFGQPVIAYRQVRLRDGRDAIEVFYGDGASFRGGRVVAGEASTMARLHGAAAYVVTGSTSDGIAVWTDAAGWALSTDEGRARRDWLFPALLGVVAGGGAAVGVASELRVAETLDDIDRCADDAAAGTCDATLLPRLRTEARQARVAANVGWSIAGVGAVGSVLATWLRRGDDALLLGWARGAPLIGLRARF